MPYEELSPVRQWTAGQPVELLTGKHRHTVYIRLEGLHFGPRWLGRDLSGDHITPAALATRNPRVLWQNAFELQLAQALLCAHAPMDNAHQWLAGPYDEDELALESLYDLAQEELAWRPTPIATAPSVTVTTPPTRRAWTLTERQAMKRQASMAPEVVAL